MNIILYTIVYLKKNLKCHNYVGLCMIVGSMCYNTPQPTRHAHYIYYHVMQAL